MTTTQSGFESRLCTGFAGLCGAADVLLGQHTQVPLAGDKPQRYVSASTLGCRCSGRWLVSPAGAGIHPGSEFGTCFRTDDSLPQ